MRPKLDLCSNSSLEADRVRVYSAFLGLVQDLWLLPVGGRRHALTFFELAAKMLNAVITTVFADLLYTAAGMCQKEFCLIDPAADHFVDAGGMEKFFVKFLQGTGA